MIHWKAYQDHTQQPWTYFHVLFLGLRKTELELQTLDHGTLSAWSMLGLFFI